MWKIVNQVLFTAICLLGFSSLLFAQAGTNSSQETDNQETAEIEIPFGWEKGDSYQYSVEKRKGKGSLKRNLLSVDIVSSSEEFVVAKLNFEIVLDPSKQKEIDSMPAVKKLIELYQKLDILVRIRKDGVFLGVENPKELKTVFDATIGPTDSAIESANLDPKKKELARRMLKETTNFERFQQELLTPLHYMLMMTGTSHSETEAFKQESTTAMLYANEVPMTETYEVTEYASEKKSVAVDYSVVVDSDEARRLVTESMNTFVQRMSPGSKERVSIKGTVFKTRASFTISTETGWPDLIQWREEVNNMSDGKLDEKSFLKISRVTTKP